MNRFSWGRSALSIYGFAFLAFIYLPILFVVAYSFNSNPINMMIWEGFTFDWYRAIFGFPAKADELSLYVESSTKLYSALSNSLLVACITTLVSTILGTSIAIAVSRFRFRLKSFYRGLMFMPMIMPDIILGIALLIFFVSIGVNLGLTSIIIGHCTFLASYVFIIVSARMADLDESLHEASADLGASGLTTFFRVTLPIISPGVMGGAMLAFIISMDDLVITYFISGTDSTTLPVHIYGMLRRGIKPEINAIATMMLLFSVMVASIGLYLRGRKR
jgi:spermidine/putrescine transport system permease protein